MNLSEIRKKALQAKSAVRPILLVADKTLDQCVEVAEVPIVDFFAIEDSQVLSVVKEGDAVAEQPMPAVFDPLSVIMAGRDSSCCSEEEISLDSSADSVHEFKQFICFRVADEKYAVNIMDLKEIIKPREVTEVPRASTFVSGILSLRGIIISVFDLRKRLGLTSLGESGKERIIVVKKGEEFCGMLVDEVIQVVRISTSSIEPPPAVLDGIDRDFVNGIGRFEKQILILLNLEKILNVTLS